MQTYTHGTVILHTHTAYSLILTRPHAGCLHSYFCLPHPVRTIATETSLTALRFPQIHPHFYSLWKKTSSFFIRFFFSYPHQKLPMCTINLSSFPSGCLIRRLIDTSFFPSATETCEISRSM